MIVRQKYYLLFLLTAFGYPNALMCHFILLLHLMNDRMTHLYIAFE